MKSIEMILSPLSRPGISGQGIGKYFLMLHSERVKECCMHFFFRAVDLEMVKILRKRVEDCVRREEVNHPQRCREHAIAYMEAFHKYKSQGISMSAVLITRTNDFIPSFRLEQIPLEFTVETVIILDCHFALCGNAHKR